MKNCELFYLNNRIIQTTPAKEKLKIRETKIIKQAKQKIIIAEALEAFTLKIIQFNIITKPLTRPERELMSTKGR